MMDNELSAIFPKRVQLVLLALLFMLCVILGTLITFLIESESGFSIQSAGEMELLRNRGSLRLMLFISNATMFLFPGILFSVFLFRKKWLESVHGHRFPSIPEILISMVVIAASIGMIAYAFQLNKMIPLPEWMVSAEADSQGLINAALRMESPLELLVCLIIVALVPAIGEEWIFRGILQKRLYDWSKNEHLPVWIMAIIFSAVHMQFQGFIPRVLLGAMLGYMFFWSGSLWLPIIAHFFNNAFQVVIYYLSIRSGEEIDVTATPEVVGWQALLSTLVVLFLMFVLRNMGNKPQLET